MVSLATKETHSVIVVAADLSGKRLDKALAELFPSYSRAYLQRLNRAGQITVNNTQYKQRDLVTEGDRISIRWDIARQQQAQAESIPLDIIFADNDLIVLNKPAGLVVHPGAGNPEHTLLNALLHYDPNLADIPRGGIIHRLDKDTSGLMVIARSISAHTKLVAAMQAREIRREYQTIVNGLITSSGHIDKPIGRHASVRIKMAVSQRGKPALTYYSVLNTYPPQSPFLTHLQIRLETGRTHQIRVHMAAIRHPVLGDRTYGGRLMLSSKVPERIRMAIKILTRQALHASSLTLSHPRTGVQLNWNSPLPYDLQTLLTALCQG